MTVELSAYEVFQIAEQVERNGRKFYTRAAELFSDSSVSKMFRDLAGWEQRHEEMFSDMRKALGAIEGRRSEEDLLPEAKLMAGLAVFGIQSDPSVELSGAESKTDVLRTALQKERDSVVFYTGLKDFVTDAEGIERVDMVIKEEMRHIRIISQSLNQAQGC